jgi:ABC-type glycerol-3-phosphate transport system substrate-binding protein
MLAVFARRTMALLSALAVLSTGYMFSADRSLAGQAFAPGTYKLLSFFPQDNYDKWLRGQIAAFQDSHQGVTIQVQYTDPTNIIQMIKTGVASGQAPDVATQLPGSAQLQLWQAGQLLDFKPFIDADAEWKGWVKGWSKVPNSQYRDGDHIFAANVSLGPMLVWYWKDMLAKVGYDHLPTDIKGLIELAAALKKADLPSMANGLNSQALFNFDYTFYTLEANWDPDGSKARMADAGKYPWTLRNSRRHPTSQAALRRRGVLRGRAGEELRSGFEGRFRGPKGLDGLKPSAPGWTAPFRSRRFPTSALRSSRGWTLPARRAHQL